MAKVLLILIGMITGLMAQEKDAAKTPPHTRPNSTNLRPSFPENYGKNDPGSIKAINPVQISKSTCWKAKGNRWVCRRTIYW